MNTCKNYALNKLPNLFRSYEAYRLALLGKLETTILTVSGISGTTVKDRLDALSWLIREKYGYVVHLELENDPFDDYVEYDENMSDEEHTRLWENAKKNLIEKHGEFYDYIISIRYDLEDDRCRDFSHILRMVEFNLSYWLEHDFTGVFENQGASHEPEIFEENLSIGDHYVAKVIVRHLTRINREDIVDKNPGFP